ncbi:MAG: MgtC/SapB family protein [Actinomycetota bacterium]
MHHEWVLVGRVALSFVFGFAIGWEREVRGAQAGDRTFTLVSMASAAIVGVFEFISPNAVAGLVTGVGFIGGGLVMRQEGTIKGITTAATIWAVSAIGAVTGAGHYLLALALSILTLIVLEFRYIPILLALDARRHQARMSDDMEPKEKRHKD